MNFRKLITIFIFVLLVWPAYSHALAVGDKVPDYTFATLSGDKLSSADIKGKNPVMMVFWATWCPHCKDEIPGINRIHEKFTPKGLKVVGVNVGVNDSAPRVEKYIKKYKINYPVTYDKGSVVTKQFGVQGTPTVILIDRNGIIRYRANGLPENLDAHFDSLMN